MTVNAWAFGTLVLITVIVVAGVLLDRMADRGHELRWHDRFYQPQLPAARRGRIVDVSSRPVQTLQGGDQWSTGGSR